MPLRRLLAIAVLVVALPFVPAATATAAASAAIDVPRASAPQAAAKAPHGARSCVKRSRLGRCERWSRPRRVAASASGRGR